MDKNAHNMLNPALPMVAWPALADKPLAQIHLHRAARFVMNRRTLRPRHRHSTHTWLLELFTAGAIELNIDDGSWQRFESGHGVLYPPQTPYREAVPSGVAACESMTLFFSVDTQPTRHALCLPRKAMFFADVQQDAANLMQQILLNLGQDESGQILAQGLLYQLLAMLMRAPREGAWHLLSMPRPQTLDMAGQADLWMRQHLQEPLTIASMARQMHMSPSGFAHAYRRLRSKSPMQHLRHLRVEAAKAHLLHNRMTLQEMATQCGFVDASHLSRVFKQITGISPRAYRQRHGSGNHKTQSISRDG